MRSDGGRGVNNDLKLETKWEIESMRLWNESWDSTEA